jgi:hypothetical protein
VQAALSSLTLQLKANVRRRPPIALSEIAQPGVRAQIEYGVLTHPEGRPVRIDFFKGNTAEAVTQRRRIKSCTLNLTGSELADLRVRHHCKLDPVDRSDSALHG